MTDFEGLPAGARISRGLLDLKEGETTVNALIVAVASRRLSELGLSIPLSGQLPHEPELTLYELLCRKSEDPFFEYRAVMGELDSFISCLEALRASDTASGQPERS